MKHSNLLAKYVITLCGNRLFDQLQTRRIGGGGKKEGSIIHFNINKFLVKKCNFKLL